MNLRANEDRALDTRVEVGAPGCQGPQVTCLSHCSSISQLANSPIFSPLLSPGPASPLPLASLPMAWPPREPTTRSSPEGSEGREELGAPASPSPPPHQLRKGRASPPDSDEGIESEEDIDAQAFKQLILSNVGPEEARDRQLLQFPLNGDKEDLYAKINFEAKRHTRKGARINSLESPSTSLCSDGNSPTLTPPSSATAPPSRVLPPALWNKSADASESECLI